MNFDFLKKTLKRQAGFSLTEILVGGGILAGVGLSGALIFKNQKMSQKKIDNEQSLNVFHQSLIRSMNNPFNCNATFKQLSMIGASSIAANTSLAGLYSCGSGCSDFKSGVAGVVPNTTVPLLAKGAFIDQYPDATKSQMLWQVNDILIGQTVNATGPLIIKVVYELNPTKFPNAPKITKDILLNARFNTTGTTTFRECLNSQESSVNNLQNDICKSLSSITSTGSVVATWDEATQSCKTNGDTTNKLKTCPAGMVIEGIRSDGSVHCKYPTTGISCPAGQTGKLKMVGGSMKVVCE